MCYEQMVLSLEFLHPPQPLTMMMMKTKNNLKPEILYTLSLIDGNKIFVMERLNKGKTKINQDILDNIDLKMNYL